MIPCLVLLLEIRRLRKKSYFWFNRFQRAPAHWLDVADRLAFVEPDGNIGTSELPIHSERRMSGPVLRHRERSLNGLILFDVHWTWGLNLLAMCTTCGNNLLKMSGLLLSREMA